MKSAFALLLCLFCLPGFAVSGQAAPPACPGANPDALAWLERMSLSHEQLSYQGVVTFQRGDDLQSMRVARSVRDGQSREYLTRLTGQDARITRAGHPQDCLHPGHSLLRPATGGEAGVCGLARFYRFEVQEGERIAGRNTVRLTAHPRDMYRYAHTFELDLETGLLLRTQTLGSDDRVLERVQFAELRLGEPGDASQAPAVEHAAGHSHPEQETGQRDAGLPWQVSWLPDGFTGTDAAGARHPRRTFTDGLAVFSVFIEPLRDGFSPGEGLVREGSTASYTRGMLLAERPVLVTVIGEVPVNTARMVADSVRLEP